MSGDVQPRKRKDKRRKKEGTSLGSIHEPVITNKFRRSESDDLKIFDLPDQGEKIHVQNEHGVGGNICVKIIFFCLFGLLVGAVGLIYMKSQGSTDVDLPTIEESRFAEYFTGWLDDNTDGHEHETVENNLDHDEHEDNDEHEDHDNHDDEDNDEHDDEHENDEEDQSPEQDSIYKLFGLQDDEAEEVEENEIKQEVTASESGVKQDVDEDEEDEDEDEDEEERNEVEDTEEDEDEEDDEEEEKNKMDDAEDEENDEEDEMKDAEEDADEDKEDSDNDSGVDLEEQDNDKNENDEDDDDGDEDEDDNENDKNEDDSEDDNLSQFDEEDEDKYSIPQIKRNKIESRMEKSKGRLHNKDDDKDEDEDEDENDDDGDDEEVEKELSKDEQSDEEFEKYKNYKDELDIDEIGKDEDEEEVPEEREDSKLEVDNDDMGFDEIEVSEEDLEVEDDHKEKDHDNYEEAEHRFKDTKKSFADDKKNLELKSGIDNEEEETEADTAGVAIKLGVGIALIIVAHLVLVKKWKSMSNVPSDENVPTETPSEKVKIQNLQSSVEPVISRRQTLVPENILLSNEPENGEMEDEEEEEEEEEEEDEEDQAEEEEEEGDEEPIENDVYVEEEEFKKSKNDSWETFEKPSWNLQENEYEEEDNLDNEELEDEEEYEEEGADEEEDEDLEEEEEVENDEEDYEEEIDDDVEDENVVVKQKFPTIPDKREEEIKEAAPIPPPRSRTGRGGQEVDEDSIEFELFNQEAIQDDPRGDEANNNPGPEEQKTQKKVGNEDEWAFRQELDFADEQFENNPKAALEAYDKIISKKPTMIRALIGRAKALDRWAEKEKSNTYLKQAINAYKTVLLNHGERLDDDTYAKLSERCIERMRFAGNFISAIDIHKALILKYPNDPKYRNSLAVTYLMLNKIPQARILLNETLSLWPENGFALVHYGFILKTSDNNMEEGVKKLMAGIKTREEGVIDGMFFFHLGDALNRLGREKEAMSWYELGAKEGLFLSKYQRSLYNVNRLKGQPWWTKKETTYQDFFRKLEDNWREIRREGLELLNSKGINLFKEEAENLKDTGDWKQLDLYFRGRKQANCNKAPVTCSLVSSFKPASTCTRGQIKFSVMLPNTHVWPHCGPTNCRLRSHLGLVVPKKTFIRVAEETRSWEEGKIIIFDDSFEHEVWHNGTGLRLVLIVDVWHPELTNHERRTLSPI